MGQMMHTSGWALMMACRLVRCGSSVYVQKKSSCAPGGDGVVEEEEEEEEAACSFSARGPFLWATCGCMSVAVVTEDGIVCRIDVWTRVQRGAEETNVETHGHRMCVFCSVRWWDVESQLHLGCSSRFSKTLPPKPQSP